MKIGIIGVGAIGSFLAKFIDKEIPDSEVVALCDLDEDKAKQIAESIKINPVVTDIDTVIKESDLIIEAVNPTIVGSLLKKCIKHKKHLMVMSVGGIIQNLDLLPKLTARLFIPSGAICGIDGIKAAAIETITSSRITTTKSPKSLEGAPYLIQNKIDLEKIKEKTIIFEGNALEAIKGFPKNVNVSAVLSLAGIGPENTKVRIICDPGIKTNMHKIEVTGTFGKLTTITENVKSPLNPKTSHLAVLSACATLKRLAGFVKIGN
jgi:aspartate dehydrogenase